MACICSGRSLSHKKGQNNAVYSNRDGPRDSHYASEKEKGKYHDIACKWKLEHNAEELITKQKTLREPTCGHQEGGMVAEGWPGSGTTMYRMDKQHGPTEGRRELYSTSCDKPQ